MVIGQEIDDGLVLLTRTSNRVCRVTKYSAGLDRITFVVSPKHGFRWL